MTFTVAAPLVLGAAVLAVGLFGAAARPDRTAALRALPVLACGAAIALVGASRLASSSDDPLAGQELAILVALGSLGLVGAAVAVLGRGLSR